MKVLFLTMLFAGLAASVWAQQGTETKGTETPPALNFSVRTIDGEVVSLDQYAGKVVMIVNVASRCGMTPQYKELQALYTEYGDKGLVILGFPCNQFMGQEPGSDAEIKEFCSTKYQVTFPMFSKIDVKGSEQAPLYKHLTGLNLAPKGAGDIGWNFEKIILDRSGTPIARFGSRVKPSDAEVTKVLVSALGQ